ncbi:hypothetical protein [Lysobacter sp. CA199]|uniref:hypothetical protein n=1 Tax=Lysobacter sp. CA199 TaxID=3455608 RepID=UPI003F8D811A
MRDAALCLAMILAWAVLGPARAAEPAQPSYDFPTQPFSGGSSGAIHAKWNIHLRRTGPGTVAVQMKGSDGVAGEGSLTSMAPVLNLPGLQIDGQYGLTGTVRIGQQPLSVSVVVGASKKGQLCPFDEVIHHNAVYMEVGTPQTLPHTLYFGCGDYREP